jgi:hypothetical protein
VKGLSAGDRARMDAQSVTVLTHAAREALPKHRVADPDVPRSSILGVGARHGSRRLDIENNRTSLGDDRASVDEKGQLVIAPDCERPIEWRRKSEGDLDRVGVHVLRDTSAGVAAVRRRQRPSEAIGKRDLHAWSSIGADS